MLVSVWRFAGCVSVSTVPAGSFAKASFVGANTVNGPGPRSVSTRPAACTAATSVVWSAEFTALSTIVRDGYIAAPPTITVCSLLMALAGAGAMLLALLSFGPHAVADMEAAIAAAAA